MTHSIYRFSPTVTDGTGEQVNLLGGKGAKLSEMARQGFNVPHGLVIPTSYCEQFFKLADDEQLAYCREVVTDSVLPALEELNPRENGVTLYSVRSGARVSLAGMMDSILNVGLTPDTFTEFKDLYGNRVAYDCRRRLAMMYANVVYGLDLSDIETMIAELKEAKGYTHDSQISPKAWNTITEVITESLGANGEVLPNTLAEQLTGAVYAVFKSWNNPRAVSYRKIHGIPDTWGTAVVIQAMCYGNLNNESGSGVLFTADPSTGAAGVVAEYLPNAQGEDVVSGVRTPLSLQEAVEYEYLSESLYRELINVSGRLQTHFNDMQDVEFTVENGELFILQTRDAKRNPYAAVAFAVSQLNTLQWDDKQVQKKLTPSEVINSQVTTLAKEYPTYYQGIAAGGNIISGTPVTSLDEAARRVGKGEQVILVAKETTPEDIESIHLSVGILTVTGGLTCHAAVVARGMGKTCVVGCTDLDLEEVTKLNSISICGRTGKVYSGTVETTEGTDDTLLELATLLDIPNEVIGTDPTIKIIPLNDCTPLSLEYDIQDALTYAEVEGILLHYRGSDSAILSDIVAPLCLPRDILTAEEVLKDKFTEVLGSRVWILCPSEYSLHLEESLQAKACIVPPKDLADLLSRDYALLSDLTLTGLFGTLNAANTVLESLRLTKTATAKQIIEPTPVLKAVCSKLMES